MRKTTLLLTVLLLLLALAACAQKAPAADPEGPLPLSEADCVLTLAGTELRTGIDFVPLADRLGAPEIEEGQACLSGGYDTNYYYGEETSVYTLAEDGKQIIYDVYTTDPGVVIPRGLQLGVSTKADVEAAFGTPTRTLPTAMRYTLADGTGTLAFEFTGETLTAVGVTDDTKTK